MALKAFIAGCSGLRLNAEERAFFAAARPCGIILFARNCKAPDQVRALIEDARATVGTGDLLVLVDQEGGRVQRLRPPHWRAYPPAAAFGRLFERDKARALAAARIAAQAMGHDLALLGINVDCAPVLDVPVPGAHDVIGDRAYGRAAESVIELGRAVCEGLLAGGVLPVIKHVPGHGRAGADSHAGLPVIDAAASTLEETDFRTFRALADMPVAMTAHVLMPAFDAKRPASVSPVIMAQVIRGSIGFAGLVMSDDIGMGALSGDMASRARAVIEAGGDVILHCDGRLSDMAAVAEAAPQLSGMSEARYRAALGRLSPARAPDRAELEDALAALAEVAPSV